MDGHVRVSKVGLLDSSAGNLILTAEEILPVGGGFAAAQFWLDKAPSGAGLTIRISKAAGETAEYQDVTIANGAVASAVTAFSSRLKFQPGEHLAITVLEVSSMPGFPANLSGVIYQG